MGTTVVEADGLQPAGGDEVPLQMTAEYNGDSSGDLQRFATIGNGRGGGGRRRLLRGCTILDVLAIATIKAVEGSGSGSGGGSSF